MHPKLRDLYEKELDHLRRMGGEFRAEYPKIAGRLGLESNECADPYVERLLESFAFLTARIQLKLDAEFPRFTRNLLEIVYPQYLAPVPSFAVVKLFPEAGLSEDGIPVPRGTGLRSILGKGEQTACEYRTAHEVMLAPIEITEAQYYSRRELKNLEVPERGNIKAALRVRLKTSTPGLPWADVGLEHLDLFLQGAEELPMHLYEQLFANLQQVVVRPAKGGLDTARSLPAEALVPLGFEAEEAALPVTQQSFEGYRLLQEYFALPARFQFARLTRFREMTRGVKGGEIDIVFLLDRFDEFLESAVSGENFDLFCTPAVNLFPRRADRISLDTRQHEYHLVVDRTRPMDFEVHSVTEVVGHGTSDEREEFYPFYRSDDLSVHLPGSSYYTIDRRPRMRSARQKLRGTRATYVGSEVFLSLVDHRDALITTGLRELAIGTWCTNRDLPLEMSVGHGRTDFTLDSGEPVEQVRCVAGPTRPIESRAESETAWRLISHLSLNYLSLVENEGEGAAALREMLVLYADRRQQHLVKQIEGVRNIAHAPIMRRVSQAGPLAFGRGLEVSVVLDEQAFEGTGIFLLGAVLERFFAKYVSVNSFTQFVLKSLDRGVVKRWPPRTGRRQLL